MDTVALWPAAAIGIVVGLVMGMLGGGGAILTLPALVYLLGQEVPAATATSLLVVGANAAVGALTHHLAGRVRWRTALVFAAGVLCGAMPGVWLNRMVPEALVLVLFAGVLLAAATMMVRWHPSAAQVPAGDCRGLSYCLRAAGAGLGIGLLTGFFGVGGGFLIVPALLRGLRIAMPQAVATSLAIVSLNAVSGLVGHVLFGRVQPGLVLPLLAGSVAGIGVGTRLSGTVPEVLLQRLFAGPLVLIAFFLVAQNVPALWRGLANAAA